MIDELLSERGRQRREQILSMAHGVARQRRRRLTIARSFYVTLMFAITGLLAWSLMRLPANSPPVTLPVAIAPVVAPPPAIAVEYIQTDPTITDRLSIKPEPPRWTNVTDTELVQELAAAGQPVGIVCMNGKTFLLPR